MGHWLPPVHPQRYSNGREALALGGTDVTPNLFCLPSSMLPFSGSIWLPGQCRGPGCLGTHFPIICMIAPSPPLFFVLFFSQCMFSNVVPSFYIHCLFTSPLAFLCSSFQPFPGLFLSSLSSKLLSSLSRFPSHLGSTHHFYSLFSLPHYHPTFFFLLSFFLLHKTFSEHILRQMLVL